MASGYTKLFSSIIASTIWRASNETRIVWVTMMAMANKDGVVEASIPGLADLARVSIEACEQALEELSAPDRYSRSQAHEGRRIQAVDGGWLLLNHAAYRAKLSQDERRAYKTEKQREYRERDRQKAVDTQSTSGQSGHIAEAEAEAEADKVKSVSDVANAALRFLEEGSVQVPFTFLFRDGTAAPMTEDYVRELEGLYAGINIRRELGKASAWLEAHPDRRPAKHMKKFLVGWLNRAKPDEMDARERFIVGTRQPAYDMSWSDECQALHGGTCNGRVAHTIQLDIDRARAEKEVTS